MLFHPRLEKGQGLTEFAFILVLIAIVCIAIITTMGPVVGNMYSSVVDLFP